MTTRTDRLSSPATAPATTQAFTARWTSAAAAIAGVALLLFPVLRPWPDETVANEALATAFASDRWILAHLCGILGLGLLAPTLLGLRALAGRHDGVRRVFTAAVAAAWAGAGTSALYFGAEIFGIHTLAEEALRTGDMSPLAEVDALRNHPAALTLFGAGLLLLAAAGVLAAVALWRSGSRPRWVGIPLAVVLALYLPQFFGGPGLRIAHGALAAVALLLISGAAVRRRTPTVRADV